MNLLETHLVFDKPEYSATAMLAESYTKKMDSEQLSRTPQRLIQHTEIPNTPDIPTPPSKASTQSWDSDNNGPRPQTPPPPPIRSETDRDTRIKIQTALLFNHSYQEIREKLGVTDKQIWWAKHHRLTPQKRRKYLQRLKTPQKTILKNWLLASPAHRRLPYRTISVLLPELYAGEQAIRTAMQEMGYCRRASKKKGFSTDPRVIALRKAFAEEAITWSRERVQRQIFSDEVWAMGGAHTTSFVTV